MSLSKIYPNTTEKYIKKKIPRALREQVWIQHIGRHFESKCVITWCTNMITVFDFHVGHNIPESQGGNTDIINLKPICARCNLSMGANYTIDEWNKMSGAQITSSNCCIIC